MAATQATSAQATGPYATDYTTLLTGSYWSGAEVVNTPVFVTYSFDATAPASDAGHIAASAYATFKPYTAAQQAQAIQALTDWSSASTIPGGGSGVTFLQVAPGQGDINFASYDFSTDQTLQGSGGEAYYPFGNWNYSTFGTNIGHFAADNPGSGNVLMNTASETNGVFAYATVLHEIGHALGLKHPTQAWTDDVPGYIDVAHNQWDPSVPYDPNFSIMSAGGDGTSTLTTLTSADDQAIQSIYGTPAMAAVQDKSWSWNGTTDTLTQTLKDDGETVRGVSTSNVINGGLGNDAIYAIGAGTNSVFGGAGADNLVGGSGTSYLDGGAGADTINGWFGIVYASYADATAGVTASLANPSLNTGDAAGDSYLHVTRMQGSAYADTLVAENSGDTLYGLGGNDSLVGGTGNDALYGGAGADTLVGGAGINNLDGGAGADTLNGTGGLAFAAYGDAAAGVMVNLANPAADTGDAAGDVFINVHNVQGSNFSDTITADNAGDQIFGNGGNDSIAGGSGTDSLYGGLGNDTLAGGAGADLLDGGAGADVLDGTGGTGFAAYGDATAGVTVNLANPAANTGDAAGDSYINLHGVQGSAYADTITGDNAGDRLYGNGGNDSITGGSGANSLYGGVGNDTLVGGTGVNNLDGGAGADVLNGTGGLSFAAYGDATTGVTVNLLTPSANTGDAAGDSYINLHNVQGSNFSDTITADNAGDRLFGNAGNDSLVGGSGNDTLTGGLGTDTLTGGAGADRFVLNAPSDGAKTITDFTPAQNDLLQVTASTFGGGLTAGKPLDASHFVAGSAATQATGQFLWNASNHTLSWDQDGTGAGAPVLIASLTNTPALTPQGFSIV